MKRVNAYWNNKQLFIVLLCFLAVISGNAQDTIRINSSSPGILIPADYTGMTYEARSFLVDSLKPSNHTLIRYFKTAGIKVFRVGGNTVENLIYNPNTPGNRHPADSLTKSELDSLFVFAGAVGCKIILDLNFGGYFDPSLVAQEVSYVMSHYSSQVLAFEIANEPNLYYYNGLRTPAYTYDSFQVQYLQYVDTIRKYTPNAPVAGPCVAQDSVWQYMNPFAHNMKGIVNLLTQHYFAVPRFPGTVQNRIDSLLGWIITDSIKNLCDTLVMRADSDDVPFRMDACNAASEISRWGLNNSFGASLWLLDYMYSLAGAGVSGINVHSTSASAATVINDVSGNYSAWSLYYGLLAFQLNDNGHFLPYNFIGSANNLAIHPVLDTLGNINVTLINKDTLNPVSFQLYADSMVYTTGQMISLTAPTVSDTFGITLGGSAVTASGAWLGTWIPITPVRGYYPITIPPATAIIVKLNTNDLGINTISQNGQGISLYPDPNNGLFTIALNHSELVSESQATVEIYNTLGEKVLTKTLHSIQGDNGINMSTQPNGVYLYRVLDENGNMISNGKFVIQK